MSRMTILQVEDDANDVVLFQHACQKAGVPCDLKAVSDGEEAIQYLQGRNGFENRREYPFPALVLLDLKMPRVSGFEVLSWLRKDRERRRLPVVVFTSSNHAADVQRAYESGANSYLIKPIDFSALVELVRTIYHYWLTLNAQPEYSER